jgi:anti-anti-sigma factor
MVAAGDEGAAARNVSAPVPAGSCLAMAHAHPDNLVVDLEVRSGEVWVLPVGELDLHTTDELDQTLSIALASKADRVVVDLRGLEFVDSTGLRTIAATCRGPEGHRVSLVPGPPAVQGVFNVSGLARELPFRPVDER